MGKEVKIEVHDTFYLIEGKKYHRITHVLSLVPKPELEQWRARIGEEEAKRISEEARDWGHLVHRITELNDLGRMGEVDHMLEEDPELLHPWVAWFDWADKYVEEWVEIERIVWGRVRGVDVGGTIDRVAIIKGDRKPSIVDLKTGKGTGNVELQTALYKEVYNKGAKRKVERRVCVRLPRMEAGKIKLFECSRWEKDRKEALGYVEDYRRMVCG